MKRAETNRNSLMPREHGIVTRHWEDTATEEDALMTPSSIVLAVSFLLVVPAWGQMPAGGEENRASLNLSLPRDALSQRKGMIAERDDAANRNLRPEDPTLRPESLPYGSGYEARRRTLRIDSGIDTGEPRFPATSPGGGMGRGGMGRHR